VATIEAVAIGLARIVHPIGERLEAGEVRLLLAELGMELPPELDAQAGFAAAVEQSAATVRQFLPLLVDLARAAESEDVGALIGKGLELINLLKSFVEDTERLAEALRDAAGSLPGVPPEEVEAFANQLPRRLLDYLVVRQVEAVPAAASALEVADLIEREETTDNGLTYYRRSLKLDQLGPFLSSPGQRLEAVYGWGRPDFDGQVLLERLEKVFHERGIPAVLDTSLDPPVLDALFFEIQADTSRSPPGLTVRFGNHVTLDENPTFAQDGWSIEAGLQLDLEAGAELTLEADGTTSFAPVTGQVSGKSFIRWTGGSPTGPAYVVLGEAGGSRLEVRQAVVEGSVGFVWDVAAREARGVLDIGGEVLGGRVVIDFSQADGFLGQILAGFGLKSDFDFGFGFSTAEGVYFHGSSTLHIQLPLHVALGPVDLNALVLSVGIQGTSFPIGVATNIRANLGPLQAAVEEIGIAADLALAPDGQGTIGPVDIALRFQPPKGVGLSLDVGAVKGGGYLYFDSQREEYAGALELTFANYLSLKAIGLITTRMPDGSKGFSLLIIITAEFGAGLQLGFGFTLLGVGGLLGLNRTVRIDPLATGVRTGAIESVLFPKDVVANAPRILSDLRTFFPPQESIFLIGPMAKLGWGTPPLVSLSLGVIIQIPGGNIVILGVFKVALPHQDAALLVIQVNFIGALEWDRQRAWFYAQLFESRVLFLTIEGGMGLLLAWGDNADFVVSVGGFHPRFDPPPLPFDEPPRIAFSLLSTPVARVNVEGYFAVTSNTVQFGARVSVLFGVSAFGIQGHIGFDALFQFSPFYFLIEISASLSVKVFGIGLFSVRMRGSLEGPSPWHIEGTGSISLLFFDIDVDFSHTWGETTDTSLPPIQVLPILAAEYNKLENWRAELPATSNLHVSLRAIDPAAELVLHPVGFLRVSQRAVPLDLTIDKVGSQKPSDANKFSLSLDGAGFSKLGDVAESFAKAQYVELKDAEKLDLPAFEPLNGGANLSVAGDQLRTSGAVKRVVRYETIIIDTNFKRFHRRLAGWIGSLFGHFLAGNVVARSSGSYQNRRLLQPFEERIVVEPETFTVASARDNRPHDAEATGFRSDAMAREYLQQQLALHPQLTDKLHVVPSYEANTAAP
jgi:hypothetical protein